MFRIFDASIFIETPGADGNLCRALGGAIGVIATHGFVFTIAPELFTVLVALIGGDHHHDLHTVGHPGCLHDMDGAHDIGFVGLYGDLIAETHQGLGCQMEDHLRLVLGEDFLDPLTIPDICPQVGLDLMTYA